MALDGQPSFPYPETPRKGIKMSVSRTPHDTRIVEQFTRWAKPFAELAIHAEAESMAQTLAACAVTTGMKVLDVACGPGIIACELARTGAQVTGIDLTPAMIQQARLRADSMHVSVAYHVGNALHLPFQADSFDRVVTRYSFHHMQDPGQVLAEMVRVCRPGGRIIVIDATPAPECQEGYDRAETLRDPSHTSALTLPQLVSLGAEAGLSPVEMHQYRLESRLQDQVAPEDWNALQALFAEDIAGGQDCLGMGAWEDADGIHFYFPISIVVWSKSMHEKAIAGA
jgi:ubiquinone/menaquinone biosynthesis C-methylase UbiE